MTFQKLNLWILLFFGLAMAGCEQDTTEHQYTGYVEAEYFYIAAPESGWINHFDKKVGHSITNDETIAVLDDSYQTYNQQQWQAKSKQASAQLANLQLGARADEIAVLENKLSEVKQNKKLADIELERVTNLFDKGLSSEAEVDKAKYHQQALAFEIASLASQLKVAQLPAREHVIKGAEQELDAVNNELNKANWQLAERTIKARNSGIVDQVFYRQGEFINRGQPLISVLLTDSQKVRFYLPQQMLAQVKLGDKVKVKVDGKQQLYSATISYIAKHSEFTPPVLYGKGARDSLVFLLEAKFEQALELHKGQPVDVLLND